MKLVYACLLGAATAHAWVEGRQHLERAALSDSVPQIERHLESAARAAQIETQAPTAAPSAAPTASPSAEEAAPASVLKTAAPSPLRTTQPPSAAPSTAKPVRTPPQDSKPDFPIDGKWPVQRKIAVGYFNEADPVANREQDYQMQFDHELIFFRVDALNHDAVKDVLSSGHNAIVNLEFLGDSSTLQPIIDGVYDEQVTAFAQYAADDGRYVYIANTTHSLLCNNLTLLIAGHVSQCQ
jgi:hypothetical protein